MLAAAAVAAGGGAAAAQLPPLPTPTPTSTPTPSPTPEPTPSPTPTPTPGPAPLRVTIRVDRQDVFRAQRVRISGRVEPPPAGSEQVFVEVESDLPGLATSQETVGRPRVAADGTFRIDHRPDRNTRYFARATNGATEARGTSEPVMVYADYRVRTLWRPRKGGRLEAVLLLSNTPGSGFLVGKPAYFYAFRRRTDRFARRVLSTRVRSTNRGSDGGRSVAYSLKRVRSAGRIRFLFGCVRERRPDIFGRPDDPIQRQCGRTRLRLPTR